MRRTHPAFFGMIVLALAGHALAEPEKNAAGPDGLEAAQKDIEALKATLKGRTPEQLIQQFIPNASVKTLGGYQYYYNTMANAAIYEELASRGAAAEDALRAHAGDKTRVWEAVNGQGKTVGRLCGELLAKAEAKAIESFPRIDEARKLILASPNARIYEGLPHPLLSKKQLEEEMKLKKHIQQHGFAFYDPPQVVSEKDTAALKAILKVEGAFQKYSGPKRCGGFHPDFSLHWANGDHRVEVQFCLGCHEYKIFGENLAIHGDVDAKAYEQIKALLEGYHKQSPKPAVDK